MRVEDFHGAAQTFQPMRLLLLLCTGLLLGGSARAAAPDLILHHGKVVTVDPAFSVQEAIAIEGSRIAAVGSNDAVLRLRDYHTEMIDLHGHSVLPGLIDSHTHPLGAAMTEADH